MNVATNLSEQIAVRVNCHGIGDWLSWLAVSHGKTFYDLFPIAAAAQHEIPLPQRGVTLVLRHPHAGDAEMADPERWILESAIFDPLTASLPFGLDARSETPDTAKAKLSGDIVVRDLRVSYFLPDARVVELTFTPGLKGLTGVQVVRLGAEMEYADEENSSLRHYHPPQAS